MNEKLNCISKQADRQKPYSGQNYFLIHGITEENQEITDAIALKTSKEKLDIELTQKDLDKTHRIDKNDKSDRPRPVILKFIQCNRSEKQFQRKSNLKVLKYQQVKT